MTKTLVVKLTVFIIGLLVLFPLKSFYLLRNDKYKQLVTAKAVYRAIEKSKKRNPKAKKVIIGDSVAYQLFLNSEYNDSIYSMTSNQAVTFAGQYFLLNNFLSSNPEVETVVFINTPFDFKNDLNQKFTYGYFLKPFYRDEYKGLFTKTVNAQIQQVPYYYACQVPPILTSNWSPDWDGTVDTTSTTFISQLSSEYLSKMIALCKSHSVKFQILPTPTRISRKGEVEKKMQMDSFTEYDFSDYFSRVTYIPDSCFLDDVHLKKPSKFVADFVKSMYEL